MNYWLVRTKWGGENKKADFINNDEWINGYETKYQDIVNRVEAEDILLLAEDSTVTHYGICSENEKDGRHLLVDKWILLKEPVSFPVRGSYIKTIVKINDEDLIETIKLEIEKTLTSNDIKIKSIFIENFTVFKSETLEFSDGLNVVVGENGTGKTHLLKLLYSLITIVKRMIDCNTDLYLTSDMPSYMTISNAIQVSLFRFFKPDKLDNLINRDKDNCSINVNLKEYPLIFKLIKSDGLHLEQIEVEEENLPSEFYEKSSLFIPAKEMLSFYEGFVSSYNNRENSFDETYYDLAKSLSLSALKNIESYQPSPILNESEGYP